MSTESEWTKNVMVGALPGSFLRVGGDGPGTGATGQIMIDQQAAAAMHAQQAGGFTFMAPSLARLSITVCQGKLTKNYGLMKMDLYCRIRVGHSVFETNTCNGAGKNPRWNKVIQCHIPQGVDAIYLEIFDEKAFTMDDRVAWAHIPIPEKVYSGENVEEWWHLNGKQGDGKEGMINMVLSYTPAGQVPVQQPVIYSTGAAPMMVLPNMSTIPGVVPGVIPGVVPLPGVPVQTCYPQQVGGAPVAMVPQQPMQQQPVGPMFTNEDVTQVRDVFPNIEEQVVRSVLEANRGNKDATINSLLSMDS